eukprot:2803496-Amphidinium_carterae.1
MDKASAYAAGDCRFGSHWGTMAGGENQRLKKVGTLEKGRGENERLKKGRGLRDTCSNLLPAATLASNSST